MIIIHCGRQSSIVGTSFISASLQQSHQASSAATSKSRHGSLAETSSLSHSGRRSPDVKSLTKSFDPSWSNCTGHPPAPASPGSPHPKGGRCELGTRGMARQHSMTWGLRPDGERSSRITRPTRLRLQNKMAYATLFLRLATCPRGRPKTQLILVDRRGCWDRAMLLTCKRFDNFLTQVVRRYCGVVQ